MICHLILLCVLKIVFFLLSFLFASPPPDHYEEEEDNYDNEDYTKLYAVYSLKIEAFLLKIQYPHVHIVFLNFCCRLHFAFMVCFALRCTHSSFYLVSLAVEDFGGD